MSQPTASDHSDLLVMGEVIGVFGVQGWITLRSYTEPLDGLIDHAPWLLDGTDEITVERGGWKGKRLVAQVSRGGQVIDDRDVAAALIGKTIQVPRNTLPAPDEDEYYWADLVGLSVVNTSGEALGEVIDMLETSAHDVMVVQEGAQAGSSEKPTRRLIPFVQGPIVESVDLDTKTLRVAWEADWDATVV